MRRRRRPFDSAKYAEDYKEVKEKGALTGSTRTAEQTDIGYFWTDNFGVQWNRAIRGIIEARVPNVGNRARLLALVNMAIADAVITAWDSKLHYNLWRPLNAIREGEFDPNAEHHRRSHVAARVNNPPYPDYTSGANNLTGAATKTLELFFGRDNIAFKITSNAPAAIKKERSYASFTGRFPAGRQRTGLSRYPLPVRGCGGARPGPCRCRVRLRPLPVATLRKT